MTEKVFNLQVKLVADSDRGRTADRKLIETLVGEALKTVIPEAIVLKVEMKQVTKK